MPAAVLTEVRAIRARGARARSVNLVERAARPREAAGRDGGLSLLVLGRGAVRIGYLLAVTRRPGYRWIDPDRYATLARVSER